MKVDKVVTAQLYQFSPENASHFFIKADKEVPVDVEKMHSDFYLKVSLILSRKQTKKLLSK